VAYKADAVFFARLVVMPERVSTFGRDSPSSSHARKSRRMKCRHGLRRRSNHGRDQVRRREIPIGWRSARFAQQGPLMSLRPINPTVERPLRPSQQIADAYAGQDRFGSIKPVPSRFAGHEVVCECVRIKSSRAHASVRMCARFVNTAYVCLHVPTNFNSLRGWRSQERVSSNLSFRTSLRA
jgi:hypothetical protein